MKQFFFLNTNAINSGKKLFLFILLLVIGVVSDAQPAYWNALPTAGANVFPFNINPGTGKKVQYIIAAGEFNQPTPAPSGNITTLWVRPNAACNASYTTLTIKMATVPTSTYIAIGAYYTGPMTTVLSQNTTITQPVALTWTPITLTTPFTYDPTQNLVIEISQCGFTGTGFNVNQQAYGVAPNYRRQYSDAASVCGVTPLPTGGDLNLPAIGVTFGSTGTPAINAGTATLTGETCVPNNGVIDPSETVTVNFCALNTGTANTTNLVGTMQVSGGVTPISGPQNYGVLTFGGAAVCRAFTFSNSGSCGGTITVAIQWQDGALNLGTSTWTFTLGSTVVAASQNFDGVVAPALPAGWVASNASGPAPLWVTSSAGTPAPAAVSLPNSIFIDDPNTISDKRIETPSFTPGPGARVTFQNNYALESTFDGGVLEISINGGAYQDLVTAGGAFTAGGYNGVISVNFGSPILGRNAWTGSSGGFITTTATFPPAATNQPCKLRFRMGSDNSIAATGWRVDNFSVTQLSCCLPGCTITLTSAAGTNNQTKCANTPITPITYSTTTATGATFSGLPPGVTGTWAANVVTISGTPTTVGVYNYTVTLVGCAATTATGTITVIGVPTVGIIEDPTGPLCAGDPKLLTAINGSPLVNSCFTQSSSQTPVAGSVACNAGGITTDNSYWRVYPLTPYALPGPLTITSVRFGIEILQTVTLTARLYVQTGAAFPGGTRTLISTTTPITLPTQNLTNVTVPIAPVVVNPTDVIVIELFSAGTGTSRFFIGSNAAAETGLSYISAAACGIANPVTLASLGFPNMHIILDFCGSTGGGGAPFPSNYTYLWSPAAGLSSTTTNPTAASPMVTTTYTVTVTTPQGCVGTGSVPITVYVRPKVLTQPANVTLCATNSASFTITATGQAITYQWQESRDAGATWANLANAAPYSGVTTPTLTINPAAFSMNGYRYRCVVSGYCSPDLGNPNISNAAILTVVALPNVTIAPNGTICGGVAGISGVALTASGANTYVWAPVTGLFTDPAATIAYTGTNLATVYAAPTAFTTYTVTGTNTTTGCINTSSVNVNYTPPPPIVTPNPVTMCLGDPAVRLISSSATPGTCTVNSGAINIPIPDANATNTQNFTAISTQNVSCIPANATITGISVTLSIPAHTYVADLSFNLKSPSGTVINLFRNLGATGGVNTTYPNSGIVNLTLSSASSTSLTTANTPAVGTLTGTYKADILNAISAPFYTLGDPPGYPSTAASWTPMFANAAGAANGNWILAMTDDGAGDIGSLTNWTIKFDYIIGVQTTAATWSPIAGLFNDAIGTPYTGTPRDTVWTRPTPSGVYNYNVTVQSVNPPPATVATPMAGGNGNNMIFFNVNNSNAISYNITGISTNAFTTAVAPTVNVYRKTSPIAGNPGAINAGNGWILVGSASNVSVTANTLNAVLTGLAITIPAGQTYGIGLEFTGAATFPAYTNGTGTVATYTNNGCSVIVDGNVGWGGPVAPGPPANNPRNFNGTVFFAPANLPACTSPARVVTVTVNQPISITTQPISAVVCTDKSTSFTVVAAGTSPTYRWQVSTDAGNTWTNINNGGVYSGATTATLTITAPPVSYNGYQYRCVVSGAAPCQPVNSQAKLLTVNPLPTILLSASPYYNLLPNTVTTLISTTTPIAATYTWFRNESIVPGATASSLLVNVDGQGRYRLRVTDVNGCVNISNQVVIADSTSGRVFVSPNPTSGQFVVRYNPAHNNVLPRGIVVYDGMGKRVLVKNFPLGWPFGPMAIDLSNHATGVYWLEVLDANNERLAVGRVEVVR